MLANSAYGVRGKRELIGRTSSGCRSLSRRAPRHRPTCWLIRRTAYAENGNSSARPATGAGRSVGDVGQVGGVDHGDQALVDEPVFGGIVREVSGLSVGGDRLVPTAESPQEISPGGVVEVVVDEIAGEVRIVA